MPPQKYISGLVRYWSRRIYSEISPVLSLIFTEIFVRSSEPGAPQSKRHEPQRCCILFVFYFLGHWMSRGLGWTIFRTPRDSGHVAISLYAGHHVLHLGCKVERVGYPAWLPAMSDTTVWKTDILSVELGENSGVGRVLKHVIEQHTLISFWSVSGPYIVCNIIVYNRSFRAAVNSSHVPKFQ